MFCPYCESQIPDGSSFCTSCGAQLPSAAQTQDAMPMPAQQPVATPGYQDYQQQGYQQQGYQQNPPYSNGPAAAGAAVAGMPSTTAAIVLIVVGFICGIIWGVIGVTQYGTLKLAVERGDVETAKKKFNVIMIATIIGIVINIAVIAVNFLD